MEELPNIPRYKIDHIIERFRFDSQDKIARDANVALSTIQRVKKFYGLKKRERSSEKIVWTEQMLAYLQKKFKNTDNYTLAYELGISESSLHRKARELGLKKSRQFIRAMQAEAASANQMMLRKAGKKYWNTPEQMERFIEGGRNTRFKKKINSNTDQQ